MRRFFSFFLLITFILSACGQRSSEPLPASSPPTITNALLIPTLTSSPPTRTATTKPATPPVPTSSPEVTSVFSVKQGNDLPPDRPLIAYEIGAQNKTLLLADPVENTSYEFSFPATAHFATPLLAGLSPDARYIVYFEGGWLETLYEVEHLRASTSDLALKILDLRSGTVIFSAPLLSPTYPQDLAQIAETIKDDWHFTFQNASFEEVVAATQEMLLDHIRRVAWSPDSSLLAFASQDPGPSSDLFLFSPESMAAHRLSSDPGHVLHTTWAPDSSALVLVTSLYDRHAREDSTYLLTREGSLMASLTSQIWNFIGWHDSDHAILYGATDSGDYFEPKAISARDGSTSLLWYGSFANIAFSPDLSSFLLSSNMPSPPGPPHSGLYLGKSGEDSLLTLSEIMGWNVGYWGSERFAFAASSIDEGTIGVSPAGERQKIDDGYWRLAAAPGGRYLAGYHRYRVGYLPGVLSGLRIFDSRGQTLEAFDDLNVNCVQWNAAGTALAYQADQRLYLWEAAAGTTRLITDQLNDEGCLFNWVRDSP